MGRSVYCACVYVRACARVHVYKCIHIYKRFGSSLQLGKEQVGVEGIEKRIQH